MRVEDEDHVGLITVTVCEKALNLLQSARIFQDRYRVLGRDHAVEYRNRWKVGDRLLLRKDVVIEPYSTIGIGRNLFTVGSFSSVMSAFHPSTKIGRFCSIAKDVKVGGFRHPIEAVSISSAVFNDRREFMSAYAADTIAEGGSFQFKKVQSPQKRPGISVGHDVWIGSGVLINRGVSIGTGAVIASNSLVTKDVKPYEIVGGNPAKHIKYRFDPSIVDELLRLEWWRYRLEDLHRFPMHEPTAFVITFGEKKEELCPYEPAAKPISAALEAAGVKVRRGKVLG